MTSALQKEQVQPIMHFTEGDLGKECFGSRPEDWSKDATKKPPVITDQNKAKIGFFRLHKRKLIFGGGCISGTVDQVTICLIFSLRRNGSRGDSPGGGRSGLSFDRKERSRYYVRKHRK